MQNPMSQHYDATASFYRIAAADSGADHREYALTLEDVPCLVQPLDDQFTQDMEGGEGRDWLLFADKADVLVDDKVTVGGKEYRVVGVRAYDWLGRTRHMEVRIREAVK